MEAATAPLATLSAAQAVFSSTDLLLKLATFLVKVDKSGKTLARFEAVNKLAFRAATPYWQRVCLALYPDISLLEGKLAASTYALDSWRRVFQRRRVAKANASAPLQRLAQ